MLPFSLCSCQRPASFALACPRSQERGNWAPTSGRWAGRDGAGRARVPARHVRVGSTGFAGRERAWISLNHPLVLSCQGARPEPNGSSSRARGRLETPRSARVLRMRSRDAARIQRALGPRRDLPQVLENAQFAEGNGRKRKSLEGPVGRDWKQKGQDWKGLEDNGNRRMRFLFGLRISSCAPCQRNGNGAATP